MFVPRTIDTILKNAMRRLMPSRPNPQSLDRMSRSSGNVLERAPNQLGHLLGPLDLQVAVIDDADRDLLVGDRRPISSRSMPSLVQHSNVITSTSSWFKCGSASLYD